MKFYYENNYLNNKTSVGQQFELKSHIKYYIYNVYNKIIQYQNDWEQSFMGLFKDFVRDMLYI